MRYLVPGELIAYLGRHKHSTNNSYSCDKCYTGEVQVAVKVYSIGISFILESQGRLSGGSDNRRWPAEESKEDLSRRRNNMGKGREVRSM